MCHLTDLNTRLMVTVPTLASIPEDESEVLLMGGGAVTLPCRVVAARSGSSCCPAAAGRPVRRGAVSGQPRGGARGRRGARPGPVTRPVAARGRPSARAQALPALVRGRTRCGRRRAAAGGMPWRSTETNSSFPDD